MGGNVICISSKLNNLTIIVDYNKLQSLTTVEKTIKIEPLKDKFEAFGCCVSEVNGHDHEELKNSLSKTTKTHQSNYSPHSK